MIESFVPPEHHIARDEWIVTAADVGKPGEIVLSLRTVRTGQTGELRCEVPATALWTPAATPASV